MANEYIVNAVDLTAVAEAIRSKSGNTDLISFPNGFVDTITSIEGGASKPVFNMPQTDLTFNAGNLLGFELMVSNTPVDINYIVEGASYKVNWSGEEYDCTAWKLEGIDDNGNPLEIIAIGNTRFTTGTLSAEPFIIGTVNGEITVVSLEAVTTVRVSVTLNLSGGGSAGGEQYALITVTAKRGGVALSGATVTATKGSIVLTGVSDTNGQCVLKATETGTYSIKAEYDGITSSSGSVTVSGFAYSSNLTFFTATITVATETGATVTVTKGDKTYTATAENMQAVITVYETGTYTVTSSYNGNSLTNTVNVTTSTNYNLNIFSSHLVLEDTSWETISTLSAEGNPQNYFAIGDTKSVHINGIIQTDNFNVTLYAYIIGFNHNEAKEGKAIHFGTFKTADGKDVALVESKYGSMVTGTNTYGFAYGNTGDKQSVVLLMNTFGQVTTNMNFSDFNRPVYTVGEERVTSPTEKGFISALPADLRAVMKKVKKSFFEKTGSTSGSNIIYDAYLNVPSEYEVFGTHTVATASNHPLISELTTYQQQYEYYKNGNSKIKYKHNSQTTPCDWLLRDNTYTSGNKYFGYCSADGKVKYDKDAKCSLGVAPIFFV